MTTSLFQYYTQSPITASLKRTEMILPVEKQNKTKNKQTNKQKTDTVKS